MRSKEVLDGIAEEWAEGTLNAMQNDWSAWDMEVEDYDLTDEEFEYLTNVRFTITVK